MLAQLKPMQGSTLRRCSKVESFARYTLAACSKVPIPSLPKDINFVALGSGVAAVPFGEVAGALASSDSSKLKTKNLLLAFVMGLQAASTA